MSDTPGTELVEVDREIAAIESTMGTDAYVRDEGVQARYRDLVTARSEGRRPRVPGVAPRKLEKADLEKLMADQNSEYWKGPRAAALQNDYRALLRMDDLGYYPNPDAPPKAVETATRILSDLDRQERDELVQTYDVDLPAAARQSIEADFAAGPPSAPPASATDLEIFKTEPNNAAMAREWGTFAAAKLGVLRARLKRIVGPLSPEDREQTLHWLNTAPTSHYMAILRHLVGP